MKITLRGEKIDVPAGTTKADLARVLLEEGYSVSEISKAVPMAYSQVSTIAKKMAPETPSKPITNRPTSRKVREEAKQWAMERSSKMLDEIAGARKPTKAGKSLGACSNCGFEVVGQRLSGQNLMIHRGMSVEEYRDVVQFCHAYPSTLPTP